MQSDGGLPTLPTSREHTLTKGTKLGPTEEGESHLNALNGKQTMQLRNTMMLFGDREKPTGRNSYKRMQISGRQLDS